MIRNTEAEQGAFFSAVHARAVRAERKAGSIVRVLDVADVRIRLQFAGPCLADMLMPPLEHLCVAGTDADVTFHIWESATTGIGMVPPPCTREQFTDRGDVWGFNSERYRTAFHWIECSVNLFDVRTRTAIWWVDSADRLPYWTKASPLRTLFHWCMELYGKQLLHAAAVGDANGAVLITGKGGVGKSTTALAALGAGFDYVGDDYVIVGLDEGPSVYCLYGTAKVNADQAGRFPALLSHVAPLGGVGEEKTVIRLFPAFAGQIARRMRVRALLTPRFSGGAATSLVPAEALTLARATSFTTMSQLPYAGRRTNDFIQRLVAGVPGFEIALGTDLDGVIGAITGLLRRSDTGIASLARPAAVASDARAWPLVSIIIPVYNGAHFLRDAVDNILGQHYAAVEIIVVDDGSTDDIDAVIAGLPVDVRYFKQKNAGAASARNRGIRDASGELITFLDVDDLWPEHNLRVLVDALRRDASIDVVRGYGQLLQFDDATGRYELVGNAKESFPDYIGAGLYRRRAFERVGLFDAELQFAEDTDWFNRARESGIGVLRLAEVTLLVRRHAQNMTRGKSIVELNALRVFKKAIDRRRARDAGAATSANVHPREGLAR
jgi:hypothetical protein